MSVAPGWTSLILSATMDVESQAMQHTGDSARLLKTLKVVKLCRMLRLARLVRLVERWQASAGTSYYNIELMKFVYITSLSCHWFACALVMMAGSVVAIGEEDDPESKTWVSVLIAGKGDPCTPSYHEAPGCVYSLALYWAAMTITGVGYGDITPQNLVEYIMCTFFMLCAGYVWAYIIGQIVSLLTNLDPHAAKFKQNMDDMNAMIVEKGLPYDLQVRLRSYMHESKHMITLNSQRQMIGECLSPGLQRELAAHYDRDDLLRGIYWARHLEQDARLELVMALRPMFFGPNEVLAMFQTMFIIRQGVVAAKGLILFVGDAWGHDSILLENKRLHETSIPRTLSYVDMLTLSKDALADVCHKFPLADRRLRRAQVRTAVLRGVCIAGRHLKQGLDVADSFQDHVPSAGVANTDAVVFAKARKSARELVEKATSSPEQLGRVVTLQPSYGDMRIQLQAMEGRLTKQIVELGQSRDSRLTELATMQSELGKKQDDLAAKQETLLKEVRRHAAVRETEHDEVLQELEQIWDRLEGTSRSGPSIPAGPRQPRSRSGKAGTA
eukprot:gnl/TRDRNA2_/TRDRNA2_118014_c0_seq1.p1 gnl/TRDRNA2_/TRDRNA2_118014_c0~~gnl/TRDRNA2_/TRDRNA2_118014_c0_seq1.p1  ORF type:complete len:556 (+),score=79.24 gnl/TRDRNA2_/TRDRNA2_118014_c0_seq1:2-1669(+)